MRKITGLLYTVAASAALVAAGLSPAVAQDHAAGTSAAASSITKATVGSAKGTTPSPTPKPTAKPTPSKTAVPSTKASAKPPVKPPVKPSAPPASAKPAAPTTSTTPKTTLPKAPASTKPKVQPVPVPRTAPVTPTPSAVPKIASKTAPKPAPAVAPRAAAKPAAPKASDPFVAKVLAKTNEYRAKNGAGPLVLNATIGAGSQQWAVTLNDRINKGTLDLARAHRADAGASILPAGHDMYSEIIGINGTAEQIVDWWMSSPAHRTALLDKRATDLGLGYVTTTKAGWSGMKVVVGNLAGYPASRKKQPQPAPAPVFSAGDIAAVDPAGNLYAYPSAKGGDLWNRNYLASGWSGTQQMAVVDYNNDGRQDLVAVWADGRLTVSYGLANGTLKAPQGIGTGWGSYDIVVTKWKSGSTYPSIMAKHRTSGQLFLYPNLDGSRFGVRQLIGTGWGRLTILDADFDGDRKQDLLARNAAGQLLLYRGNGAGTFMNEPRRVVGTGWGSMRHVSGIANHTGTGSQGVLARSADGILFHYTILHNGWGARQQIGTGGWESMKLGS